MLISTALVMLMTPGLAFFYGGMVRRKNVLGTIMQSFAILCIVSVIWVLWGYTLAFGPDKWGIIGGLEWIGLRNVGQESAPLAPTIPHLIFMMFQGMFAIITPALITGAFAERMKFSALILFSVLWLTFVYSPLAHWVWGGGWIGGTLGALDFAGGTVVHINSAIAAITAVFVIGKRRGYGMEAMPPHNLPMTILGAALLWFGWFGFNAGSALTSGGLASVAFVTTNTATGAAAMSWLAVEWIQRGRPTALGAVSGAVAGLVAITPAAGFVSPLSSILIGIGAGVFCYMAVNLKQRLGYDDSLDVLGIHGVGGTWGALATGLFASTAINPAGKDGLFFGNPPLLGIQAIAVVATYAFVFAATLIILKIVDRMVGLRVDEEQEHIGLDQSQHGESGYIF
ncbi:MAG: ammonium transporter [Nitrospirae bacterium]|nr:ammonium transporter [Nitrospirota bacterium]MDA8340292.1 ammonium transporter [Nitrospiraceae bacterium]